MSLSEDNMIASKKKINGPSKSFNKKMGLKVIPFPKNLVCKVKNQLIKHASLLKAYIKFFLLITKPCKCNSKKQV